MTSSFPLKPIAVLLAPLVLLAGCSTDRVVPRASVGERAEHPDRRLIGRVGDPGAERASRETVAPMSSSEPLSLAEEQAIEIAPAQPASQAAGDGAYVVPPEGVNMDTGLGIGAQDQAAAPVMRDLTTETAESDPTQVSLPDDGAGLIEGETAQPVIDGIGTDNPVALDAGPDGASPYVETPVANAPFEDDGPITPDPDITGSISRR